MSVNLLQTPNNQNLYVSSLTSNTLLSTNINATNISSTSISGQLYGNSDTATTLINPSIFPISLQAGLYLQKNSSGNFEVLSMDSVNSQGYLFSNSQLSDGIDLSYNWYYATGSNTPTITNTALATSRIGINPGTVSIYTGATNTTPIERLRVDLSTVSTQNGGNFAGPILLSPIATMLSNYIESLSYSCGFAGPWGAVVLVSGLSFVKVGRTVTCRVAGVTQTAVTVNTKALSTVPIPAQFRPDTTSINLMQFVISLVNNNVYTAGTCSFTESAGLLNIQPTFDPVNGAFTVGNIAGWNDFTMSWNTAITN